MRRWLFADPNNAEDAAYVRQTLAAIDGWWKAFAAKRGEIESLFTGGPDWDLADFMEKHLQAIHPHIMWEFGPSAPAAGQAGHRLVITPENQRWLRPMVRAILERHPKIANWQFYPYRLAETVEQTVSAVKERVDVDVTSGQIETSVAPGRKIDLLYSFPEQPDLDEETALQAAFVTTEVLLGEQVLDTWIGEIGLLEGQSESGSRPLPLARAQATVAALIHSMRDQLPSVRVQDTAASKDWATIKLDPPEQAADYPGRSDLVAATTHNVQLFQAIHSGALFESSCHSRMGELFCYTKIDGRGVPPDKLTSLRLQLQEVIDVALREANFGCSVGGGNGLRYVYIDLALTDLAKGAALVQKSLASQKAPVRSWLLFHDDDLAAEWVGGYPETPEPPREEEE